MFYHNCGGNCPDWLSTTNHCTWSGITCDANHRITKIELANRQLSGTISEDLATITNLLELDLTINDFTGAIPTPVCDRSTSGQLTLSGDATNCPNVFDATTGLYGEGCCDNVNFLDYFIEATYGNESCEGLVGIDSNVCTFMQSRSNHDHIYNWNWLQERVSLATLYFNNCGSSCSGWLSSTSHCEWPGVTCDGDNAVVGIDLSNQQLGGAYPEVVSSLSKLSILDLSQNNLLGGVPAAVCDRSTSGVLTLSGDATNCPNLYNATSGEYLNGCCDTVIIS